jgi:hypothetical protein
MVDTKDIQNRNTSKSHIILTLEYLKD